MPMIVDYVLLESKRKWKVNDDVSDLTGPKDRKQCVPVTSNTCLS